MANLEIDNVSKKYGNTQAVNGVSLKVESGTFTVILAHQGPERPRSCAAWLALSGPIRAR